MRPRLLFLVVLVGLLTVGWHLLLLEYVTGGRSSTVPAKSAEDSASQPMTVARAAAAILDPTPPERWVSESANRRTEPDMMGPAGAALVSAVAQELRLKRAELDGIALALSKATAAVAVELNATRSDLRRTQKELEASVRRIETLETPWLGRAGEVPCAYEHRCSNYIEAGEQNLTAVVSVTACREHCSRTYPLVPFFAFHNELGMVQFLQHLKGRCRCYESTPCDVVPDGGYTLWSTNGGCPRELLGLAQQSLESSKRQDRAGHHGDLLASDARGGGHPAGLVRPG